MKLCDPRVKCRIKLYFNKTFANKRSIKLMFYDLNIKCPIMVYYNKTIMNKRPIKVKVIRPKCQGSY